MCLSTRPIEYTSQQPCENEKDAYFLINCEKRNSDIRENTLHHVSVMLCVLHFEPQVSISVIFLILFRSSNNVCEGNACYHSVQNLLSSRLLSKNLKVKMYRTIILPVVLYGCETWSLILREERKLRLFENMVLRRIFGPRRDEVTGEWRRLHNEELNDLYSSPNIVRLIKSRRMRWAGHVARMGEERGRIGSWWGNRR